MANESISVVLVYEPATPNARPVPLARIGDSQLILAVAKQAIADAISRAVAMYRADEVSGELEQAEADRLQMVLAKLIPETRSRCEHRTRLM